MTLTVHAYSPTTLRYVGPVVLSDGDRSPLQPDAYLIPGCCVEAPPPEAGEGQVVRWDGEAWEAVTPLAVARIDAGSGIVEAVTVEDVLPDASGGRIFRPAEVGVAPGWTWDGEAFVPPTPPVPTLDDALAIIANYRWNRTQAMNYDGETAVPADQALSVITSIAVAEQLAPSGGATRTFKLKPGAFRQWTVAQITAYGMAIGAYVQACFDREKELADQATGGDITGALADLETGWPA